MMHMADMSLPYHKVSVSWLVQDMIKTVQQEIDGLVKKAMKRPRESLSELDDRLK